jgi:hypothetical protein
MPFPSGAKVAAAKRCAVITLRTGFSYEHERENRSQNDQCIYASNHDAEINVSLLGWNFVFLPNIALLRLHKWSRRWAFVR